jgi:adenylate cyclase
METIQRALLIDPDNDNMKYNFACVLTAYLFEFEPALDLLEEVFKRPTINLMNVVKTDPDLDPLRGNPRFEKIYANAVAKSRAS